MKRLVVTAAALLLVSHSAYAQNKNAPKTAMKAASAPITSAGAVNWGAPPPVLPAGTHLAVLSGDPGSAGEFTIRLHLPAGTKIMPHYHPNDEHVTVLKGTFHVGMGDKMTEAGAQALPAGGYITAPANAHHFAWAEGDVIVQVNGMCPFKLTYVNPADDPSKKK